MGVKDMYKKFRSEPVATISELQDQRFLWILMAATSLLMLIVAHSVFQIWLYDVS